MEKTFKVITLGCRTNQYESAVYAKQLSALGYREAKSHEAPEICIVNTCTVTQGADRASRHEIRSLARKYPHTKIVATGCLATRLPDEVAALPGSPLVVINQRKEQLIEDLFPQESVPSFTLRNFPSRTRAFVKIQDGCNSFCTYCIIPYVRGRSRSRTIASIEEEVKSLVVAGHKEIVLTGINIGDFDGNPDPHETPRRLHELIAALDPIEGLRRLRLSSIDPDEVDDALIDVLVQGEHTCHSLHLVLQSGSNTVLKRMNRKYTKECFLEAVSRLRNACADFTFSTDVIVGFPGESESDFLETLDVMEHVQFSHVHMFPFSPRKRTRAEQYHDLIPQEVMRERKQEVLRRAEAHAFALRQRYVGRTMRVLLEAHESEQFSGHTNNFLPVFVNKNGRRAGDMVDLEMVSNSPLGLQAR
jgi:threonylcarbamoyladenosine tRNA methylthiotransferase MtaB